MSGLDSLVVFPVGIIYKLYCSSIPEKFYIGSTTQPLSIRLSNHKGMAHTGRTCILYQIMRETGTENWSIEELSRHNNVTRDDLKKEERKFIDELKSNLNTYLPYSSPQEKKEKMDKLTNTRFICECGGSYTYRNKTNHMRTDKHRNAIGEPF